MNPLLKIAWTSKTLSWGRLISNQIGNLYNTILLSCIAIDVLSMLDTHWGPVVLVILLNGELSAPTWTNIACYWGSWCSVIWWHVTVEAKLCLSMKTPRLAVVHYRCHIYGIHPVKTTSLLNLIDRLVCIFDNTNVPIFIHQWISSLKSFFEIRIQRLFSHDVRDTTILVGDIDFLVLVWLLVTLYSVEWPLCVIFNSRAHLIWSHQFCGRLFILIEFLRKVNPFDLLDSLLLFDVGFHLLIFDWR